MEIILRQPLLNTAIFLSNLPQVTQLLEFFSKLFGPLSVWFQGRLQNGDTLGCIG